MSRGMIFEDVKGFYEAVKSNDDQSLSKMIPLIYEHLQRYLIYNRKASVDEARECVSETIAKVIEQIRQDKIRKPDRIGVYFLHVAVHTFYSMIKEGSNSHHSDKMDQMASFDPNQLTLVVQKEEISLLYECIDSLKESFQTFIRLWLKNPNIEAEVISQKLSISTASVYTRKHRVIKLLRDCLAEKS